MVIFNGFGDFTFSLGQTVN